MSEHGIEKEIEELAEKLADRKRDLLIGRGVKENRDQIEETVKKMRRPGDVELTHSQYKDRFEVGMDKWLARSDKEEKKTTTYGGEAGMDGMNPVVKGKVEKTKEETKLPPGGHQPQQQQGAEKRAPGRDPRDNAHTKLH